MSYEPSIEVSGLGKRFRKGAGADSLRDLIPKLGRRLLGREQANDPRQFWALRNVDFSLQPGEALGIIGHNGAGKSTLLKILSRILRADEGSMRVRGRLSSLIEVGAGFHGDLTGRENVYLNGAIMGMNRRLIDRKLSAIIDFAELDGFMDTPIKRYSSGMQARLGYSVAAHLEPRVLLVDEVLSVGDYHFQTKCLAQMRRFIQDGVTVVFVSHNMNAVGALCTRCLLLKDGRQAFLGEPSRAIEQYFSADRGTSSDNQEATEAVRLRMIQLTDARGRPAGAFRNGDRVRLAVEIDSDFDADVSVGMVLENDEGIVVSDVATTRFGGKTVSLRQGETRFVEFAFRVRFNTGAYRLSLNVENPLTRHYHLFARSVASFTVTDGEVCGGVCHIDPVIRVGGDKSLAVSGDAADVGAGQTGGGIQP